MVFDEERLKRLRGTYSGLHKGFLVSRHPKTYVEMEKAGTLTAYLETIGNDAANHYVMLSEQMEEIAKAIANPVEREDYINRIPLVAGEMVRTEIVFVKL